MSKEKAVLYVRVSTDKQVESYSLDAQEKILTEFAKANQMTVVKVYREEGKSARYTDNRPVYQEMMKHIQTNPNNVDVVLTHKLDRLNRGEFANFQAVREFQKYDVRYIATADGIDSNHPDAALLIAIHAALSANYSRNLAKETRKGLLAGAENCQHMGGQPPYGFTVNKDTRLLEIDETTAPAVRKIFELYADGFSASEICEWLEENGYKTANDNPFSPNTLNSILHNEKYRGCFTWDKTAPKDSEGHRNGHAQKENYIKIEGGCPAIVTKELFDKAQERLLQNHDKATRAKPKRYYPLNGYIYCAECGTRMTGNVCYSGGRRYFQYRCSAKCGNRTVKAEALEESILNILRDSLFSKPNQAILLKALNHLASDKKQTGDTQYQQLKSKLSGLEKAQDNLLKALENGKATKAIQNRLDRKTKEIEQTRAKLEALDRTAHTFTESDLSELKKQFTQYILQSNGNTNIKSLVKSIINRVDVSKDDVKVTLSDGISVDTAMKKTLNKENTAMNTVENVKMDAILMSVEMKDEKNVRCKFAVRTPGELNYEGNCELNMDEKQFYGFAKYYQSEYFELVGAQFTIAVQMNDSGRIVRIVDLIKAA